MPTLPVEVRNFPAGAAIRDGTTSLTVSWPELVWGAISVGRGNLAHIVQHGHFSIFEMVYRAAIVYANLVQSPSDHLVRSSAYQGLDPSEKSAISYFLGLMLTKVFVAKSLSVEWLMHLDVYRDRFGVDLAASGGRPDLFGQDPLGRWVVAESKGRTNGHDEKALIKAKAQASQVISVDGATPHLSIGLVASFASGILSLVADDPPVDSDGKRIALNVSRSQFLAEYYRPFRVLVEELGGDTEYIRGQPVRVVSSRSGDFAVGVEERRLQGDEVVVEASRVDQENQFLGGDGVYVRLGSSWEVESMRLEPQSRRRV